MLVISETIVFLDKTLMLLTDVIMVLLYLIKYVVAFLSILVIMFIQIKSRLKYIQKPFNLGFCSLNSDQ